MSSDFHQEFTKQSKSSGDYETMATIKEYELAQSAPASLVGIAYALRNFSGRQQANLLIATFAPTNSSSLNAAIRSVFVGRLSATIAANCVT
jgi:hypothetical protein